MIFTETKLKGAYVIDLERREDARNFFARAFCQHELEAHGLKPIIAQTNVAYNHRKGTVRGMHFQIRPAAETKLVRCTRGAILDIIVDLRPESPTYLQDRCRNPTTQEGFAERWGQNPSMVTSFADGSKVSFEQAIVANACRMQVKSRGMSRG